MTMSIVRYQSADYNEEFYGVTFFEDKISTIVTAAPSSVDSWIAYVENKYQPYFNSVVVGLDCEWRPNSIPNQDNPVATLQLCVGLDCLIFQIFHSPEIPWSLKNFLRDPSYTFTGAGVDGDVDKLFRHWNMEVAYTADVRELAAKAYGDRNFRNAGLAKLTMIVMGKTLIKPQHVTRSDWDNRWLTPAQVQYACIDAFVSYKIAKILIHNLLTRSGRS